MPHIHRGVMGGDGSESGPWDRSLYNAYMLIYQIVCFHFISFLIANSIPVKLKIIKTPFLESVLRLQGLHTPTKITNVGQERE